MLKWRPQRLGETRQQYEARVKAFAASVDAYKVSTKAALNAGHAAGPDETLTGTSLPPRSQVPASFAHFQPALPPQVQQAAKRADKLFAEDLARRTVLPTVRPRKQPVSWVTSAPIRSRKHRATGERKGRKPNEDAGLGAAVNALAENRVISPTRAQRVIVELLVELARERGGKLVYVSAMNRVRRARQEYIRQCNRQGLLLSDCAF
jgi:hypothetical protein